MDVLAVTDFPDIRYKSAVQSPHGNLLVIPREGGYLVRLYVEMDKLGEDERVSARGITVDTAMRLVRFFGGDVQTWMNLQTAYEIKTAEAALGPRIAQEVRPRES